MKYFVGFTTAMLPNAESILPMPVAPKNYKDEAKILAYVEKARLDQLAEAAQNVVTSVIEDWCILDEDGKELKTGTSSSDLLDAIEILFQGEENYIIGLDIKRMLYTAVAESQGQMLPGWAVFRYGDTNETNKRLVDPLTVLFGKSSVNEEAVIVRYGQDTSALNTAHGRARLAHTLGAGFPSCFEG